MFTHRRKKARFFTYIEMMMVILLITIIGGALLYNMQGGVKEAHKLEKDHAAHFIELALVHAMYDSDTDLHALAEAGKWDEIIDKMPMLDEKKRRGYKDMLQRNEIAITRRQTGEIAVVVTK